MLSTALEAFGPAWHGSFFLLAHMEDAADRRTAASEDAAECMAADGATSRSGLKRLRAQAQDPRAEDESTVATEATLSGHAPHDTLSNTLSPTLNTTLTAHDAAVGGGDNDARAALPRGPGVGGEQGLDADQAPHGGVGADAKGEKARGSGADAVGDDALASAATAAPSSGDLAAAQQPGEQLASGSITSPLAAPLGSVEAGRTAAADEPPADAAGAEAQAAAADETRRIPDVTE